MANSSGIEKASTTALWRKGVIGLALGVAVVLLFWAVTDPAVETTNPSGVHAAENSKQDLNGQGTSALLPPQEQSQQANAIKPETISASKQQPVSANNPGGQMTPEEPTREESGPFSISGMVVDETGRAIWGIELLVSAQALFPADGNRGVDAPGKDRTAVTDSDGFYEIRGLADGEYRVVSQPDDFYEPARINVRAGSETADLVLHERLPGIRISGIVTGDGEPLIDAQVMAVGQPESTVFTDERGFYELELKMKPGKAAYSLQFMRDGYREKRAPLETGKLAASGRNRVDADLEPRKAYTEVSGVVRDTEGTPVPGETIQLYSESARQRYSVKSDRKGAFWIEEVETSPDYLLSVNPDDRYRDYSRRDVDINVSGQDLEIVLEPLARGSLTGQMVDPNGMPVPGFSLWLRNPGAINQPSLLVTGDEQGLFKVEQIEEGELVFETQASPLFRISGIRVTAQEQKNVRLVLDSGKHQVSGLVVDDTGRAVAASELFVTSVRRDGGLLSQATRRAITDEYGNFLVTWVGPGYHTIRVDAPGYRTAVVDHDVGRDSPEVIIRLERMNSHGM